MIDIQYATSTDFPTIQHIARQTWPVTFGEILSDQQIAYMLEMMYSETALTQQITEKNHVFLLAQVNSVISGFVSYELHFGGKAQTKIHKIYLLPQTQGQGIGKALLDQVQQLALKSGDNSLTLHVNRFNKAVNFYEKMGFEITAEEDIDIGGGFWMQDFVMTKRLTI
jgi:diamine N-acetyltransferase